MRPAGPRRHHSCFPSGPRRSLPKRSRGPGSASRPCRTWSGRRRPPSGFRGGRRQPGRSVDRFKSELPRLVAMLRGEDLGQLDGDPALLACRRNPVPVLSAAVSVAAAVRAARCGAGILMEGMSCTSETVPPDPGVRGRRGKGAKVLIRRVWLGRMPPGWSTVRGRSTRATPRERGRSVTTRRSCATGRARWRSSSRRRRARWVPMRSICGCSFPACRRAGPGADRSNWVHRVRGLSEHLAFAATEVPVIPGSPYRMGVHPRRDGSPRRRPG